MARYPKTTPAHKGRESRDYELICSKGASLGIRRNRETFSVRHRAAAHKVPNTRVFAILVTLIGRLFRPIRCMCFDNTGCPGKQNALTARRGTAVGSFSWEESRQSQGHNPVAGLGTHPFCVFRGVPLRVNPTPNPTPTAPATIPNVPKTPRCAPAPATPDGTPGSVSLPEATSRSSVACCGGSGPELSPLRTLVICPALTSTQTPARLQTFTSPSKAITFIVPVVLSNATKKSVPTTPATPAGVRTSNFPSGLAIFCACVRSFP